MGHTQNINFSGVLAPLTKVTRVFNVKGTTPMALIRLEIPFLVSQAGTLFITPQIQRVCGTVDNLLFPDAALTGDDYTFNLSQVGQIFDPGSAFRCIIENTDTVQNRRYHVFCTLAATEVVEGGGVSA